MVPGVGAVVLPGVLLAELYHSRLPPDAVKGTAVLF